MGETTASETIKYLGIFKTHVDVRVTSGNHINPNNCTQNPTKFYRLDISDMDPLSMTLMALIVKAYNEKTPIRFDISETECVGYAPKIVAVRLGTL